MADSEMTMGAYNVEHDVVAQAGGAVNADQDAIFDGGAEAHGQPVCARAWPLIIGPSVRDEAPSFTEDVRGASCGDKWEKGFDLVW